MYTLVVNLTTYSINKCEIYRKIGSEEWTMNKLNKCTETINDNNGTHDTWHEVSLINVRE